MNKQNIFLAQRASEIWLVRGVIIFPSIYFHFVTAAYVIICLATLAAVDEQTRRHTHSLPDLAYNDNV